MILYHGSKEIVEYPEIRRARFNKDFYFGFYCTNIEKQNGGQQDMGKKDILINTNIQKILN